MAGQIVVSSIKTDSDNSISFLANTGATIFSANLASGLSASSFGNNTITSDKIVSVANTKISGNITSSQIAPSQTFYGNTALTGLLDLSATNAGQIKFPASQNASSDANTLDDYEEGTYTPSLSWTDGIGNMTYGARVGRYTKIGNIVNVSVLIEIATEGTAAGNVRITLPFVSKNVANQFTAAAFWYNQVTGSASGNDVVALLFPNDDVLRIYAVVTGAIAQFDNSMTLNGTNFAFNITYEV